jgi:medium-chain acyl-[acyl-carrier-protein] hydrolase
VTTGGPLPSRRLVSSRWIHCPRPNPRAALRLFCLPHAGGDTWVFQEWQMRLGSAVEVCPIRLPGRGTRFVDPLFTDLEALAQALCLGVGEALDRPFAIFGHSMGALIGFELARAIRRVWRKSPEILCAASFRAPHLAGFAPPISHLPPYLLLTTLRQRYGAEFDLAGNEDVMQLMMPILRADFSMCETYAYVEEEALACPIAVYGGNADMSVDRTELAAWLYETNGAFVQHDIEGDHFLPVRSKDALLALLANDLAGAM